MNQSIMPQAKLIAALAETMTDSQWASDIDTRLDQIQQAVQEIRRIIDSRRGGER